MSRLVEVHRGLLCDPLTLSQQIVATDDGAFVTTCLGSLLGDKIVWLALRCARQGYHRASEAALLEMCAYNDRRIFEKLDDENRLHIYAYSSAPILKMYIERGMPVTHSFWYMSTFLPHKTIQPIEAIDICIKACQIANAMLLLEGGAQPSSLASNPVLSDPLAWKPVFNKQPAFMWTLWLKQEQNRMEEDMVVERMEQDYIDLSQCC